MLYGSLGLTSELLLFNGKIVMGGIWEYLRSNRLPKHFSISKPENSSKLLVSLDINFHILAVV